MPTSAPLVLEYTRAAQKWVEALPVGGGRLGAMVFGGVGTERLQLNDDTLWSGGPKDTGNPKAREVLPQVRRAVAAGQFVEADTLTKGLQGPYTQTYLPMGDSDPVVRARRHRRRLPPRARSARRRRDDAISRRDHPLHARGHRRAIRHA